MPNILKQFGAKGTGSFNERFHRSIVSLTIVYSVTLAILLGVSSFISYSAFSQRVNHRFHPIVIDLDHPEIIIPSNIPTAQQLQEDLFESLLIVNLSLLALAIMLSYWLARKTLEPIKESYEAQQRFLGDASHELRTPIAILQMDLENELHAHPQNESAQSRLEEVRRMATMVNDILILSRTEHPARTARPTTIQLQPFITAIVARLHPLAESAHVAVTVEPTTLIVIGDEEHFSHALTNIIKNAVIYNKPDGTVTVTTRELRGTICITITDTGNGIAAADIAHIFDRFYRADKSRTRQIAGTGLGLSIAQSAVEGMNGTISIESEVGVGTVVTVCLPQ